MAVCDLIYDDFDKTVQSNDLVIVDFWATWCGPCLAFAPIFEEVSELHPDAVFAKVNIEKETQLAEDFSVRSIPMLMIFRREFAVFVESGIQTKTSLNELILEAKKIDIQALREQVSQQDNPG
jgi:thioredoxin 1